MPHLIHAVLCQQVITDTETGAVTYLNVLEEIALVASALPMRLPPIALGCLWMKSENEPEVITVRVRATSPDGHLGVYEVDPIPMEARRHRHNLTLLGIVARSDGDIVFHVETPDPHGEWVTLAVLPLTIIVEKTGE
jgi:hypothetical protein